MLHSVKKKNTLVYISASKKNNDGILFSLSFKMAFVTFKTYMYGCTRAVTKARGWGFLSMTTMNMIPINTFIRKKRKTEPQQLP